MAPRPKTQKRTGADTLPSRSMKDSSGPSLPLPLTSKTQTSKTATLKRKRLDPTTPSSTPTKTNGHDHSPVSTASTTDSKRSSRREAEIINPFPARRTERCHVFVFGAGSMGELGLGPTSKDRNVKRPRLNARLPFDTVGIVDVAVGGMHVAALDHAGGVWTWGVNDQGSLGRDTKLVQNDISITAVGEDSESEEELLSVSESTPGLVQGFPEGVQVVKLACGDSITVAIADDGNIYSWGTFRASDGLLGYSKSSLVAPRPSLVTIFSPYSISQIACGTDHVLALSTTGRVYAWGNGQQYQMGRRVIERSRSNGLVPRSLGLSKIRLIGAGSYHSFAVNAAGETFAWGLNQFGQCGVGEGGEDGASITVPTIVEGLSGHDVIWIGGGEHHSLALSRTGQLLAWGRLDINQLGIPRSQLLDTALPQPNPRYLPVPTIIPNIPAMVFAACGTHHNIAISSAGEVYSWGYGESWQVGQGPGAGDVEVPTKIVNTATTEVKMVTGGAGGQFSVLLGIPPQTNRA